ncbi:hypothetical protein QVD17_09717 [Tagetes erecta]|uniref:Uncharacterized protein n=1 Tax=Tagetes erecta TaxID=13708 RepID=A0AAD8L565_TARER|nr:hypothetical protein QVD17_09717 [Tagetes erecta]
MFSCIFRKKRTILISEINQEKKTSKIMFRSEVELGKFLGSADIIPDAYRAIREMKATTTRSGIDILAINFSDNLDYMTRFFDGDLDLVPSQNVESLDFIATKLNASFSINKAAVELFQHLSDALKQLEDMYINTPVIITGSGLGGYLAILSTLRLHHTIDVEESNGSKTTKRPICITFGTPLVGDASFQSAIAERPQWVSSFLNVVANEDPLCSFLASENLYKPFGTFLFCTKSGDHAAFDDHESILQVLDAMKSLNAGSTYNYYYDRILSYMRDKMLYRGAFELGEFNMNLLREGITLQLNEVCVLGDISNEQIEEMEKKQINMSKRKNIDNHYKDIERLNESKISMTYMEWYMKTRKTKGGYYDSYKNTTRDENESKQELEIHKGRLEQYWKDIVVKKGLMPQKEDAKLRKRWLLSGNNYRRIVEPLDIARHYELKKGNYLKNRPKHYELLEKWLEEYVTESNLSEKTRNEAASLTEDSCFWAHVEEASILLTELVNGRSTDVEKELEKFEAYVMGEINNYSVSPDVFEEKSSLMKWWNEYKVYKGNAYASEFMQYMNHGSYKQYH